MTENIEISASDEPNKVIGEWLAAYAAGTARGPIVAYLDRLIRTKLAEQKRSGLSDTNKTLEAINHFVDRFIRGETVGGGTAAMERLDAHIRDRVAAATVEHESDGGIVEPSAIVDALSATIREQTDEIERLKEELERAHDWRFHLEIGAREARASLLRMQHAEQAPTADEVGNVAQTLRLAIGWAP